MPRIAWRPLTAPADVWAGVRWRLARLQASLGERLRDPCLCHLALLHRRSLRRTLFVGITGSTGKSTTKDLIASVLERHCLAGRKGAGTANSLVDLARLVLETRRSDRYCVAEISTLRPGCVARSAALIRPRVGVVTNVGGDHFSTFRSLDAIADEKSDLVRSLAPDGIAVLNADDPRVLAMRSKFSGRTVTYGTGDGAMLRGEAVSASWPDRLCVTVRWNGQSVRVQTRLCGSHWVSAVMAALATGVALGVPLAVAADAIARVEPFDGRMSPVQTDAGITFIRDDWKAPLWTVKPFLDFVRQARAARKIVVIGTLSDYPGDSSRRYVEVARQALAVADGVIFVGPWATSSLRAKRHPQDALWAFATVREASEHLSTYLAAGDLVLLKGSTRTDHLERLVLVRTTGVACWRSACGRTHFCSECSRLRIASEPEGASVVASTLAESGKRTVVAGPRIVERAVIVVGLGNPGKQHVGTPHNVGRHAVDLLAESLAGTWTQESDLAMVVETRWKGWPIALVKLMTPMNDAGPTLARMARARGFGIEHCILVHDDLDLPIGAVRTRMRGGAGGHRGAQSVIQAFQDERIRRVKIGVGTPPPGTPALEYVLTPFPSHARAAIDGACRAAADRVMELVRQDLASRTSRALEFTE